MGKSVRLLGSVCSLIAMTGCAVNVPNMGEIGQTQIQRELSESNFIAHIQCELREGLQRARADYDRDNANLQHDLHLSYVPIDWVKDWGVTVTLEFEVEAKATTSPGLSITDPLENAVKIFPENGNVTIARSHSAKFGVGYTRDISRTEKLSFFFAFKDWEKPITGTCKTIALVPDSDLKIYDFLHSKIMLAATPGLLMQMQEDPTPAASVVAVPAAQLIPGLPAVAAAPPAPPKVKAPFSTLTYDVNFVVTSSVNATPSFKLVRVGINPDGTLFAGSRVKTDHLLLTFGEVKADGTASEEAKMQHFASLIGQAVRSSNSGN